MTRDAVSWDARAYRTLLALLPPRFRREFSDEMRRDFQEERRECSRVKTPGAVWAFRGRMLRDLGRACAAQWWRTGWPAVAALATALTLTSSVALAGVWLRSYLTVPLDVADAEAISFVLLAVVVVLLIATTILLTMWSDRVVRRSSRRRA